MGRELGAETKDADWTVDRIGTATRGKKLPSSYEYITRTGEGNVKKGTPDGTRLVLPGTASPIATRSE